MKKISFMANTDYPIYAKIWFILYLLLNFLFGISFFYTKSLIIPYIAFALINLYGITLLLRSNRQGFYTLCSSEIVFLAYTLITKKPTIFLSIIIFNFVFIIITWIFARKLWNQKK